MFENLSERLSGVFDRLTLPNATLSPKALDAISSNIIKFIWVLNQKQVGVYFL